jgi:hypothetical protein
VTFFGCENPAFCTIRNRLLRAFPRTESSRANYVIKISEPKWTWTWEQGTMGGDGQKGKIESPCNYL